nr:hypothetical protein [Gammaproteobacteria bacterium]
MHLAATNYTTFEHEIDLPQALSLLWADLIASTPPRISAGVLAATVGPPQANDATATPGEAEQAALQRLTTDIVSEIHEIRRLNEILQTYELTADERMAIEEQLMAAVRRSIAERERAEKEAAEKAARTEEERVKNALALINHRVAMGELALEEEIAALEEHLQKEKAYYEQHIDELWAIEERLYRLREQARQEELAKMRQMAEEQKRFLQAVAEADLRALREQFERQERLIERRIERLRA